jgi:hypothetical protein
MCPFPVVPDISHLHTVTSREVSNMADVSGAPITAVGEMLVTGIDAPDNAHTTNVTNVLVVLSCTVALLGNHIQEPGIQFIQNEETQWVNFGPIRVPARYNDLLLHSEFVVHGQSPAPVAGEHLPPLMKAFNHHLRTSQEAGANTTSVGSDIKVAEYYGGIGCATASLPSDFVTHTYFDSDREARTVFELNNPGVRTHGSARDAMAMGSSFHDEAAQCDMAFCGPPCSNISRLNHFRDSNASDARLFANTVDMIAINNYKLGVIETPVAIFDDDNV